MLVDVFHQPHSEPTLQSLLERLSASCTRKQASVKGLFEAFSQNVRKTLVKESFVACITPILTILDAPQSTKQQILALQMLDRLFTHPDLTASIASDPIFDRSVAVAAQAGREATDESVQIQVVTVIRSAILNEECSIHGQALMMAVRACYQIYLFGGSLSTPTCPRKKLSHSVISDILRTVFSRMERATLQFSQFNAEKDGSTQENDDNRIEESGVTADVDDFGSDDFAEDEDAVKLVVEDLIRHTELALQCAQDSTIEKCQYDNADASSSKSAVCDATPDSSKNDVETKHHSGPSALRQRTSLLQNDTFLLLRSLCKLSVKPLPNEDTDLSLRSKMFSLVLLNEVVVNSGVHFRTSRRFVSGVKTFLLQSLLKNCVSSSHPVFSLSLDVFSSLILLPEFKASLKNEIGVLWDSVLLGVAESPHSSPDHKLSILRFLKKHVCSEKQTVVDLFLNYDCDSGDVKSGQNMNVYEHICKVFEVSSNNVQSGPEVKLESLYCIDELLKSLISFHNQSVPEVLEVNPTVSPSRASLASSPKNLSTGAWDAISSKFERKRLVAADLQAGIIKFNLKPKNGLAFLHEKGIVDSTQPSEVAKFLMHTKSLDKQAIGEFMGGHQPFNREVMYAYVDLMSFHDSQVDAALRKFLGGFRLPGESQIIDRMMEKFAERFCVCNPGAFATADVAYVLAYAIIMLNTDAHNPLLKHKDRMTKEQFISNNRGINDGKDLPREFLSDLYDRIVGNEIKMNDGTYGSLANAVGGLSSRNEESDRMMAATSNLLNSVQLPTSGASYLQSSAHDRTVVQPMFSVLWAPVLVTCSMQMQGDYVTSETASLCLGLYRQCIHLSSRFNMDIQRAAFINSLVTHTLLGGSGIVSSATMTPKNIEAIQVLLEDVALKEGNFIRESWGLILRCISELDRLHLLGSGAHSDAQFFDASVATTTATDAANSASLISSFESSVIDRIFARSASLNAEGIVHFVDELCAVSVSELAAARVYSLQKLVEITYYNMDRIRLVWSRIWTPIASHLTRAGQHSNLNVAIYAIDSLRQLANKFLEKDELSKYEFQVQFLKPFDAIMRWTSAFEIREFIVQCLSRLVLARVDNVKSGWKIVWSVFEESARDANVAAATLTLQTASRLLNEHCDVIMKGGQEETPVEIVQCLIAFIESRHTDLSLEAIGLLELITKHLHRITISTNTKPEPASGEPLENNLGRSGSFTVEPLQTTAGVWLLALTGLSKAVGDTRLTVRTRALTVLQKVLREHGNDFSQQTWKLLFLVVLIPMFTDVLKSKVEHEPSIQSEVQINDVEDQDEDFLIIWTSTTCLAALSATIEIFIAFLSTVSFLLPEILQLLRSIVSAGTRRNNIVFAQIGVDCFVRLVQSSGTSFSESDWEQTISCMCSIIEDHCDGNGERHIAPNTGSGTGAQTTRGALVVKMLEVTEKTVSQFKLYWAPAHYKQICNCLERTLQWTSSFTVSFETCICIRATLYVSSDMILGESASETVQQGITVFVNVADFLMKYFIVSDPSREEYQLERKLVCQALSNISELSYPLSSTVFAHLHPILFKMIGAKDPIVRKSLQQLFMRLYDQDVMPLCKSKSKRKL
uniref:SEC7 domain-containing protein n=1 Tax=Spongospora subterranea TaxID=70186 RepID=A0A0H5R616_9EUKA|eukprot:CRZ09600.1 hypothetical protein [Spongospora subterranea]